LPTVSAAKVEITSAQANPVASSSLQDDALLLWLSSRVDSAPRLATGGDSAAWKTDDAAGAGAVSDSYL
jgi:hypothetical protein